MPRLSIYTSSIIYFLSYKYFFNIVRANTNERKDNNRNIQNVFLPKSHAQNPNAIDKQKNTIISK